MSSIADVPRLVNQDEITRHRKLNMKSVARRFWAKVGKGPVDMCWPWLGCKTRYGHGRLELAGRSVYAHRLSWVLEHGSLDPQDYVLHKCDNPCCVNPAHLYVGSQMDNVRDREVRGRGKRLHGEDNPIAKLTEDDVFHMRRLYLGGTRMCDLARIFKIGYQRTYEIISGRGWKHLLGRTQ